MKLAIVHDELIRKGGAERVVLLFAKAFPEAPIFTLSYNAELTYPEFRNYDVRYSWYGKFVKSEKWLKRTFFPFGIWAMLSLDLTNFDIILISSAHLGKCINPPPKSIVINYCHTPFRLAWFPNSYLLYSHAGKFKRIFLNMLINVLKRIDQKYSSRVDWYLANSEITKDRIIKIYKPENNVEVLNPAINCHQFQVTRNKKEFYLVVSRLEYYKRVDLVIEAINRLDRELVIIGSGSLKSYLQKLANDSIRFLGNVNHEELSKYYSEAKALIFPQFEDYGITPLEAAASGTPVIAYGKGGVVETMIPYNKINERHATALFFDEQNSSSLINAIERFEKISFNPLKIREHTLKFHEDNFINKLKEYIETRNINK